MNTRPVPAVFRDAGVPAGSFAGPVAFPATQRRPAPRTSRAEFLDPERPRDRAAWLELWGRWPDREVMAHPDYVRLFARPGDRVVAAVLRGDSGGVLYPLIARPLASEPWGADAGRACDLTTPYGYGGPFAWNVGEEEAGDFRAGFDEWARDQGAVSSFARLSLFPEQLLPFDGEVETKGANIVRRLDVAEAELWTDYTHKVRQNVNRARRLGLRVEADPEGRRLDEFMAIYDATMRRRNASPEYFHPRRFFESILRDLAGRACLYHLNLGGKAIASELVLLSERVAYSFLGGSLPEAFELRGNDLMKHEIILGCRNAGKRAFVLGGGYRGADGILAFKKSFAPTGDVDFRVGKRTYDVALSRRMEEARSSWERGQGRDWTPDPQYFPTYRA